MESVIDFFSSSDLSPHGFCLLWRPELLALHVISDGLIGLAYFSIPIALVAFIRQRNDLVFSWLFLLFAAFIMACGTTHWFSIWTIWHPDYAIEGVVKAVTAALSITTAFILWPLLPKLVAIPSTSQLSIVNTALQAEIHERTQAESKLTILNIELEARVAARTAELTNLNLALQKSEERFRHVVESTPSAILVIDSKGRIDMANHQAETIFGYDRSELVGRPVEMLIPETMRGSHPDLLSNFFSAREARPVGAGRDLNALRKDGSEFPVEIGLNPIETDTGTMVLSAIVDISDRKQKEERLNAGIKEKNVLLAEIHHRVKNNLQIVHSLLDLQSSRVKDVVAQEMLRESRNRIHSMSIIHQILYGSDDFRRVDFRNVLNTLIPHLVSSYRIGERRITVTTDAAPLFMPLNAAIPCGLIVNELISNALKHAFPNGREGNIDVLLREELPDQVFLSVSDNGIGLPDATDPETTNSLGLKLIFLLTTQLGGTTIIDRANPTRFTLRFPLHP